ncbi:MAG: hypothetical protein K0Q61_491 [Rhodococcus erythropolis]|nr:hypothetical protein [Rhodococcus erythropolis]
MGAGGGLVCGIRLINESVSGVGDEIDDGRGNDGQGFGGAAPELRGRDALAGGEEWFERHPGDRMDSGVEKGVDSVDFDHRCVSGSVGDDDDGASHHRRACGGGEVEEHAVRGCGGVAAERDGHEEDVRVGCCPVPAAGEAVVAGVGDEDLAVLGQDLRRGVGVVVAETGSVGAVVAGEDVVPAWLAGEVLRERRGSDAAWRGCACGDQ